MAHAAKFGTKKRTGGINITPFVDVLLVVLVIFILTSNASIPGIKVDLPQAAAEPIQPGDLEPLVLSVDPAGEMYLNLGDPQQALAPDRLLELASASLRREPERPVLVKADRAVPYGRVVEGMVLLQRAGARKVGFVTDPVATSREPARQR